MLEKDCNDNPISTFPPCYAFQIISTALAPRLIQSISRNVHNKNRALKQLCLCIQYKLGRAKDMKKVKFKHIVIEKVKCGAFEYQMDKKAARNSENAKGKLLECGPLQKGIFDYNRI